MVTTCEIYDEIWNDTYPTADDEIRERTDRGESEPETLNLLFHEYTVACYHKFMSGVDGDVPEIDRRLEELCGR